MRYLSVRCQSSHDSLCSAQYKLCNRAKYIQKESRHAICSMARLCRVPEIELNWWKKNADRTWTKCPLGIFERNWAIQKFELSHRSNFTTSFWSPLWAVLFYFVRSFWNTIKRWQLFDFFRVLSPNLCKRKTHFELMSSLSLDTERTVYTLYVLCVHKWSLVLDHKYMQTDCERKKQTLAHTRRFNVH